MGMHYILKDKRPDLVLSGVNKGRNAGDDVTYSGTISVAREAAMHGIKAIAFSQNYEDSIGLNFNCTRKWIAKTFNFIESYNCTDSFLNINFPDINSESEIIKGIKIVPQGRKRRIDSIKRSLNTRNEEYFWLDFDLENDDSNENSDIDAILDKYISITPISINFTQHDDLKKMQEMYGEKIDL
jgi:5'-nucleotidase